MDYDTFKYKCGNLKYKIQGIIHDIQVFFHDIFYPWNKLKIETLDRGWHEREVVMLHAMFQVLTDFIERELFSKNCPNPILLDIESETKWMHDYEFSEDDIKKSIDSLNKSNSDTLKLMKLYKWWKVERPLREANYPGKDLDIREINSVEGSRWAAEYGKYEDACDREDEENMIELIKLRKYLWT